ncbi:hypothetical protein OESDEN_05614 [Oesophagostomum dentatum]|uniref:Uncharacterized protein n=1 Tax=Oesophagostomum dentatum TaxID=61180 RepID=A0A0B1TEA2_OESDE|nr:hypothetical protein OESDEN_05614 [Oesophagostomum dentatum]
MSVITLILKGTLCLDCEDKPSHDAAIVYEFTGRLYAWNLKRILTNLLFSFAKTSSTVALMGFGCGGVTRFEGIFESSPTKYNYEHWQSWGMRYIDSEIQTCGKDSKGNPHIALERVYNYKFLQNRPPHKRLLIFMTTGNHEDETKLLYWINKASISED